MGGRRECGNCWFWITVENYDHNRHVRRCVVWRRWRVGLVGGWHRRLTSRGTRIGAGGGIPEVGRGLDLAERPWVDGNARELSDHRPKVLMIRCGKERWRTTALNEMKLGEVEGGREKG